MKITLHDRRGRARASQSTSSTVLAAGIALTLSMATPISSSLSVGGLLAILAAPLILPRVARTDWMFRAALVLLLLSIASGAILAALAPGVVDGRGFDQRWALYETMLVVGLLASSIAAIYSVRTIGVARFLAWWAVGFLANGVFLDDLHDNPWKYGLALPVSLLLLLALRRTPVATVLVALPIIVAASVFFSYRSWLAIVLAAVIVAAISGRRRGRELRRVQVVALGLFALSLSLLLGWITVQLALSGALGEYAQRRTLQQTEIADNLLVGGRPEWAAAAALFDLTPYGFGLGVTPSGEDFILAVRSMPFASAQLQDTSTVAGYFRTGQVAFHSTLWTFWANYGLVGFATVALAVVLVGRGVMRAMAEPFDLGVRAATIVLLLGTIWDLLFSPTDISSIAASLGVAGALVSQTGGNRVPDFRSEHDTGSDRGIRGQPRSLGMQRMKDGRA